MLKAEIHKNGVNMFFQKFTYTRERREIGRKSEGDVEGGDDFGIGTI